MNKLLEDYMAAVAYFCTLLASLIQAISTQPVDVSKVEFFAEKVEYFKKVILAAKKRLGYTDGLSFLEDNQFRGFEIRNGILYGDITNLERFITPWVVNFPDDSNNYKYEVGCLLLALADIRKQEV